VKTHRVKSWSWFFQAIKDGSKTHDLRKNDRDYEVGDFLELHEYDPTDGTYSGDVVTAEITYMTSNKVPCAYSSAVLSKEYAILSLRVVR
jgi:hypothetical protein